VQQQATARALRCKDISSSVAIDKRMPDDRVHRAGPGCACSQVTRSGGRDARSRRRRPPWMRCRRSPPAGQ